MRRAQIKYEPPAIRRARIKNIWSENGYTFLSTASGWKAIRKQDIELAERARKMVTTQKEVVTTDFTSDAPTEKLPSTGILSARTLLIFRVVIIIAGFISIGVTLKLIFRKRKGWKTLE